MTQNLDNSYFITYSNYFELDGKTFSFRKKQLFDITNTPKPLEIKDNNNCHGYWINRKLFSLSKLKPLVIMEEKIVDVSNLQWYDQIKLDHVFKNLTFKLLFISNNDVSLKHLKNRNYDSRRNKTE